jgi:hypothetical protein
MHGPVTEVGVFPSQCQSHLTLGNTINFEVRHGDAAEWIHTTSVVDTKGYTVIYGFHMNGFNVISTTSSSQTLTPATVHAITTFVTASVTPSPTTETTKNSTKSNSLWGGSIAGIVIGLIAVLLALAAAIAWIILRRRKQKYTPPPAAPVADAPAPDVGSLINQLKHLSELHAQSLPGGITVTKRRIVKTGAAKVGTVLPTAEETVVAPNHAGSPSEPSCATLPSAETPLTAPSSADDSSTLVVHEVSGPPTQDSTKKYPVLNADGSVIRYVSNGPPVSDEEFDAILQSSEKSPLSEGNETVVSESSHPTI